MANIPTTSTTLLRDIAQDSRHARWNEFVVRYRPMMEAFLQERFPSLEADDIIQETLVAICRVLPSYRYAPDEKGHFHNYITGILRNKALRVLRDERRWEEVREEFGSGCPPQSSQDDEAEREWRRAAFEIALRQFLADKSVADRTKRIFERTAVNGESPESVAESFKMSRHAVDQAKSRALARLREIVSHLEAVGDE